MTIWVFMIVSADTCFHNIFNAHLITTVTKLHVICQFKFAIILINDLDIVVLDTIYKKAVWKSAGSSLLKLKVNKLFSVKVSKANLFPLMYVRVALLKITIPLREY